MFGYPQLQWNQPRRFFAPQPIAHRWPQPQYLPQPIPQQRFVFQQPQRQFSPMRFNSPVRQPFQPFAPQVMLSSRAQPAPALLNSFAHLSPQRVIHSPMRQSNHNLVMQFSPQLQRSILSPPRVQQTPMVCSPQKYQFSPQKFQHVPLSVSIPQHIVQAPHAAQILPPMPVAQVMPAPVAQVMPAPVAQVMPTPSQKYVPYKPTPSQNRTQQSPVKTVPTPQQKPDKDELEKRFNEALDRTKKIVEKFQNQERLSPQKEAESRPLQSKPKQEEPRPKSEEDEDEENALEDLALQYEDGYIYRGQGILPQTREGFGVLTDANEREVYAGFWKDNFYHREGRLNNLSPQQLEGPLDWKNMTSIANGWVEYQGEFEHGKMHGKGLLKLSNDESYHGEFTDGMIDGAGVFTDQNGKQIKGIWDHGFFTKYQS